MDNILTTMEAAKHAGVHRVTILGWIKKGKINPINRNVSTGAGCGYKIRQSELDRYIHGWTFEEEPRPTSQDVLVKATPIAIDKELIRISAENLRIAIDFAQEELSKIEALL